ncbi:hypothetical protein ACJX0J_014074, partial [Zea mays]
VNCRIQIYLIGDKHDISMATTAAIKLKDHEAINCQEEITSKPRRYASLATYFDGHLQYYMTGGFTAKNKEKYANII